MGDEKGIDDNENSDNEKGLLFNAIPNSIKYASDLKNIVSDKVSGATSAVTAIPGNIAGYAGEKARGVLQTADAVLRRAEESKSEIKDTIGRLSGLAKLGAEASNAIATPLIESSPTVIAATAMGRVAAKLAAEAAETAAKAARAIPPMPALPTATPPAIPSATPKPTAGGGNNQIGGLKQLVNEKKIITKRIAKTLKSFHRTNTRKRRRNKSKRVRFAL